MMPALVAWHTPLIAWPDARFCGQAEVPVALIMMAAQMVASIVS